MGTGYWLSMAIYVAAKLGLADLLAKGPQTPEPLANVTGTHAPSLYRLLRALASKEIFAEQKNGTFALTPMAEYLRSDMAGSMRSAAIMMGEEHFRCWAGFEYSVRTGRPAFEHVYGNPVFQYLSEHPEKARIFDEAMVGVHGDETQAMLEAFDFSGFGALVDIGGGNGSLLTQTLIKNPNLQGILYDLPHVVERATPLLQKAGIANRWKAIGGSFFGAVPPGGDAYLMRHILHDWYDPECQTILKNIHKAIPKHGQLLVVETVIPPGNVPHFAKLLDLNMLAIPGGMERTEKEYRALYASAGFRLDRVVPTTGGIDIIMGVPV
ncbi:MAG TPA: methyltransferase [Gemmataceae bacterium]|jgi:hypothetical protein|nr:methyltransferase [Gemmataceae bacterium]